jgi:Rrf2 family protein
MELGRRRGEGQIPAREIAQHQDIPLRFLEHQLAALHKAGLVASSRGAGGGCSLAGDPGDISVAEVIEVLEGPLSAMFCLDPHDEETCPQSHACGLQELWSRVETAVRDVFARTTLDDLIVRHGELQPLLSIGRASSLES